MSKITDNVLKFQHAKLDPEHRAATDELSNFVIDEPELAAWCLVAMEEKNSRLLDILCRIEKAAEQHPGGVDAVFSLIPEVRKITASEGTKE